MNLAISSTGFSEPGYAFLGVNKDNLAELSLDKVESLDNLVVHRALHLVDYNRVLELLKIYYDKLKTGGTLILYCIDVYKLCHKVHRREIGEGDFNNFVYENGQVNSVSTLFFLDNCAKIGFKKIGAGFDGLYAKLEFIK